MQELAPTACSRCRDQKLRCSREHPKCERCLRLGATCVFPEPPDRKKLASQRASTRKRKAEDSGCLPDMSASIVQAGPFALMSPNSGPNSPYRSSATYMPKQTSPLPVANDEIHIPQQAEKALHAVYFNCIFNASMLFQRDDFAKSLAEGSIARHTRLAICALASNFVFPGSAQHDIHASAFQDAGDLKAQGQHWASSAGREVLQTVDMPTLNSVRTCQTLALYWYSQGETQRNSMFSGIAYRSARVLRLDAEGSDFSNCHLIGGAVSPTPWLHSETVRRCMWATWNTSSISSDHYIVGTSSDPRTLTMPLPISEAAYNGKLEQPITTLSDDPRNDRAHRNASIVAAMMRLILIWTKIRDFLETRKESSQEHMLADLFSLDAKLSTWAKSLPSSLTYSKSNLHEQLAVMRQPVYTLVHVLYHQCRLVLHASLVPQFNGTALQDSTPAEAVQMSAQVTLKSAHAVSDLAADVLALDWDPASLAPFLGYTMYTAATVHLPFVASRDQRLREKARKHLTASLRLLKSMKPFWRNLEKLWARIHLLYEVQMNKLRAVAYLEPDSNPEGDCTTSDIDKVACTKRDAGRLAEPLADSVLDYGLRRLQQTVHIDEDSPSAKELEMVIRSDQEQQQHSHVPQTPQISSAGYTSQPTPLMVPTTTSPALNPTSTMPQTQPTGPDLQDIYGSLTGSMSNDQLPAINSDMNAWWQWDFADVSVMPWQDVFDTTDIM